MSNISFALLYYETAPDGRVFAFIETMGLKELLAMATRMESENQPFLAGLGNMGGVTYLSGRAAIISFDRISAPPLGGGAYLVLAQPTGKDANIAADVAISLHPSLESVKAQYPDIDQGVFYKDYPLQMNAAYSSRNPRVYAVFRSGSVMPFDYLKAPKVPQYAKHTCNGVPARFEVPSGVDLNQISIGKRYLWERGHLLAELHSNSRYRADLKAFNALTEALCHPHVNTRNLARFGVATRKWWERNTGKEIFLDLPTLCLLLRVSRNIAWSPDMINKYRKQVFLKRYSSDDPYYHLATGPDGWLSKAETLETLLSDLLVGVEPTVHALL